MKKILLILFFVFSCCWLFSEEIDIIEISEDERSTYESFIKGFILDNSVIYTVFGSKPLSCKSFSLISEIDCIRSCQPYLASVSDEEKLHFLKSLKEYYQQEMQNTDYQKWMNGVGKEIPKNYQFRACFSHNNSRLDIHLLNTQEALWCLEQHYDLFRKELGEDFDLPSVVLEFTDANSKFWNKIFSNNYLLGVLYGYGQKNAFFFAMERKNESSELNAISFKDYMYTNLHDPSKDFIEGLGIPSFRSFYALAEEDPMVLKYSSERKLIQNKLKGKNIYKEVLKHLLNKQVRFVSSSGQKN